MESILGRQIEELDLGLSEAEVIDVMKALTGTTQLANVIPEVWSREIEKAAQAERVMRGLQPQVVVNTDLLNAPGDTVHIAKKLDLTPATEIAETADIIPEAMAFNEVQFTPTEWGKAVQISRKGQRRAYINTMEEGSESLGIALAQGEDLKFHTQAVFYAIQSTLPGAHTVPGTITASDVITAEQIRRTHTLLRTAKAPKPYVVVVHTEQEGDLLDDEQFIDASKYGSGDVVLNGEIGKYLGMPVIASQNVVVLNDGAGAIPVYRGLMLAPRSLAIALKANPDFVEEYHATGRKTDLVSVMEFEIKALNPDRYALILSA